MMTFRPVHSRLMSQYHDRLSVYQTMLDTGLVPLFYHSEPTGAHDIADAIATGGARVLEFTNRGARAIHVFTALRAHIDERGLPLILGIGSIVDAPTAALFIAHGAEFVVGPTFSHRLARLCNQRKIAYLPGCATASEIARAEEFGAEIVKVFPGSTVGGPGFIRSVRQPMPWSRLMPTGGVAATEDSIRSWMTAGACCVGMGSKLIAPDLVDAGDYPAIAERTRMVLAWIDRYRTP